MNVSIQKNVITKWLPVDPRTNAQNGIRLTLNADQICIEQISTSIFSKKSHRAPFQPVIFESRNITLKDLNLQKHDHCTRIKKLKEGLNCIQKKDSDSLDHVINKIHQSIFLDQAAKPYSFRWLLVGISLVAIAGTAFAYDKFSRSAQDSATNLRSFFRADAGTLQGNKGFRSHAIENNFKNLKLSTRTNQATKPIPSYMNRFQYRRSQVGTEKTRR